MHLTRIAPFTLALLLGAALLLPATPAHAAQGTITLVGGQQISGDITELVPGDHVSLLLPSGQLQVIAWSQLGAYQLAGGVTITINAGINSGTPAPPPPTYTPAPPPPPPTYAAPPGAYPPPPPPPPPREFFRPRFNLGMRLGTVHPGGSLYSGDHYVDGGNLATGDINARSYLKDGGIIELDLGVHFNPWATAYIGLELGLYSRGPHILNATREVPTSFAGYIGIQGTTNPQGWGLYYDVATGIRSQRVPGMWVYQGADTGANFLGWEIGRLGLGVSGVFAEQDRGRLDLFLWGSFGYYSQGAVDGATCDDRDWGDGCFKLNTEFHTNAGIAAGLHFDL